MPLLRKACSRITLHDLAPIPRIYLQHLTPCPLCHRAPLVLPNPWKAIPLRGVFAGEAPSGDIGPVRVRAAPKLPRVVWDVRRQSRIARREGDVVEGMCLPSTRLCHSEYLRRGRRVHDTAWVPFRRVRDPVADGGLVRRTHKCRA